MVREVDGLGGLVSGELVPQHEVTSLVTPLQDGHQVVVGSTEIHFALHIDNENEIRTLDLDRRLENRT